MGAQWKAKGKAEAANARGKIFTKLSREITVSARAGADPDTNAALRMAVEQARKASMPKDTIERAIKKGAGLLNETVNYELVTYEGYAPHQVPVIVECLTDNKNRTASGMRVAFRNGQLGSSGSVAWTFDYLGLIEATAEKADANAEEAAIEAGAQDLEEGENGEVLFMTDPSDLMAVAAALPEFGYSVQSAKLGYVPKNAVSLEGEALAEVEAFLEKVEADDDVQNIYVGLAG
ncbi:YebC/PmpR family DNA-binding transcriptional regulator [Pokkaliibacter plantistimulans]|uniref:Probable transcriptional regulatory protein C4K68_17130 n=1 Tax=Proteobacteria bacterium 228 TaxID=2083153 RepID=A0A2S5KN70_9PROT|nr:YebC/PmpR family DNA-binding transcriptional regulator [Pokkaliibacter plantistimulans]PPC76113.1 YebC/PmpR family DNA-binding transcriptional regulator [Pokkaliibacter plantistimulans]